MTSAIRLQDLKKIYRPGFNKKFEALKGISLDIQAGEAFGFIGQNGAGKSTTIKILTGALQPSAGSAELFGVSVDRHGARTGLGYVPENPYLYDYLTPLEVLLMGARLHKVQAPDLKKHCMRWLERFSIAHVANKRIRGFSKGMTQRTALAHAFAVQPRLLILDEPLSGLDPVGRKEVVDIMGEYKRQGGTLFFSSHVLHDVELLADRFGLIHKGELRAVQTPAEILAADRGEVIVRFRSMQPLDGALADGEGQWKLQVGQVGLWAAMRGLEGLGAEVVSVTPAVTLETAYVEFVRSNTAQGEVYSPHG